MEAIKEGDFVILIAKDEPSGKLSYLAEGILNKIWQPDEYPDCIVNGVHYDLTSEGGTVIVLKK